MGINPIDHPKLYPGAIDNVGPGHLTPRNVHGRGKRTRKCAGGGYPVPIRRHCKRMRGSSNGTQRIRHYDAEPERNTDYTSRGALVLLEGKPWSIHGSDHAAECEVRRLNA